MEKGNYKTTVVSNMPLVGPTPRHIERPTSTFQLAGRDILVKAKALFSPYIRDGLSTYPECISIELYSIYLDMQH